MKIMKKLSIRNLALLLSIVLLMGVFAPMTFAEGQDESVAIVLEESDSQKTEGCNEDSSVEDLLNIEVSTPDLPEAEATIPDSEKIYTEDIAQSTEGDLSIEQLADRILPIEDTPEIVSAEAIEENNHVNRLWAQEPDLCTVMFQNRDGSKTAYFYPNPVKYIDEDGIIRDKRSDVTSLIDNPLYREDYAYVSASNDIKTYFPKTLSDSKGIVLAAEGVKIEMSPISGKDTNLTTDAAQEAMSAAASKSMSEISRNRPKDIVTFNAVFGTDTEVQYTPIFNGFKEDIILNRYTGINKFSFLVKTNGLGLVKNEFGEYCFINPLTGEQKATLGNIFVFDSREADDDYDQTEYSHHYQIDILEIDQEYVVTIVIDVEYLICEDTVYPVIIDPTVTISSNGYLGNIQDSILWYNYTAASVGNKEQLFAGFYGQASYGYLGCGRPLIKFPGLSIITDASSINSATLSLYSLESRSAANVSAYIMGQYWTENTSVCTSTLWNGYTGSYLSKQNGFSANTSYNFPITTAVQAWKNGSYGGWSGNYGVMLIADNESDVNKRACFASAQSSGGSSYWPKLVVDYNTPVQLPVPSVSPASLTLIVGQTYTITATFNPSNAVTGTCRYSWSSSILSINSCVKSGNVVTCSVTAIASGTGSVSFWCDNNPTAVATCAVTVNAVAPTQNTRITSGEIYFIDLFSGTNVYLDVIGASTNPGTRLCIWNTSNPGLHQKFKITWVSGKGYRLTPQHATSMAVTVDNSNQLVVDTYNSSNFRHFWYIRINYDDSFTFINISTGGEMRTTSTSSGSYVDVNNNSGGFWKWRIFKYKSTVNNRFDDGYSVRYGEARADSITAIDGYMRTISNRYLELLGLWVTRNNVSYFGSAIDTCKGTTVSCSTLGTSCGHSNTTCNVNVLCSHSGTIHTDRNNVISNFSSNVTGSNTITNAYWSGHHITSLNSDGTTAHNRSCSSGTNIFMLEISQVADRLIDSQGILMHELNHQYGGVDHYHELDASGNCKFASICSICGTNPRPRSCVMRQSRQDITLSTIICTDCIADIQTHLNNHH